MPIESIKSWLRPDS